LPKVIGFEGCDDEVAGTSLLPAVHMKMENCQPEAEKIILQFLQEYFKVTDNSTT
jgi:hypothetical protein